MIKDKPLITMQRADGWCKSVGEEGIPLFMFLVRNQKGKPFTAE